MTASSRILSARLKLMLDEPYLASAIARLPFVDATDRGWCELIATDGYYIYFNRNSLDTVEEKHLPFLIAHEVMHCVLGHMDRRGNRDREMWNYAIDYATNNLLVELGLPKPPIGLFEEKFRRLTAEEIYNRLVTSSEPLPERVLVSQRASSSTKGIGTKSEPFVGADLHVAENDLAGLDHRESYFPSAAERVRIQRALVEPVAARLRGHSPGRAASEIHAAQRSVVAWQVLLARFVSGLRRSDYRLWPPNRKHIWRGLYLPSIGAPGPHLLVVAIDTSASMAEPQIAEILAEIAQLRAVTECRLVLIQCDAAVQSVETYEPYEDPQFVASPSSKYQVRGRGGTDFRPVFDWIDDQHDSIATTLDALIYCTDGGGHFPKDEPGYPVMWIGSNAERAQFPFGSVIMI